MSWNTALSVVSAVAAIASGVFWVLAARITVPNLSGFMRGPSKIVQDNSRRQGLYNGIAAWLAAITAFCQGISTVITIYNTPTP